jgi:transcriptional regulator with XRE-family HTH domain
MKKLRYKKRREQLARQIAARTKARRKELGYTQQIAALLSGVGWSSVVRIEAGTGDVMPTVDVLAKYADALDMPLAVLFAEDEDDKAA